MTTVVILAKNEAGNLRQLIPTLSFADKILVVDDNSHDDTREAAVALGARVVQHDVDGDFAAARNFALSQIDTGLVLFLDADERIDNELAKELAVLSRDAGEVRGYQIQRLDVFSGKTLHWGETKSIWLTRLAFADAGKWSGKVHEVWNVPQTKRLNGKILHYSHESVGQLFSVVSMYARLRARELYDEKQYWSLWEQLIYPFAKLLVNLFWRLGVLDGWRGVMISVAMSWHSWLVRWYLWEKPWANRSRMEMLRQHLFIVPWILLPLGQLNRIQITQTVAVNVFEVFMALYVLVCVNTRVSFPLSKWWPSLIFSLALAASWLVSLLGGGAYSAGLYWLRWWLYIAFIGYGWVSLDRMKIAADGLLRYVGYGLIAGGFLQYIFFPDLRWLYFLGWDDHFFRMTGLLFDPNYFGLIVILVAIWAFVHEKKIPGAAVMILCLIALAATYSRASYLVAAVSVLWLIVASRRWLWLGAIAAFGGVVWLLPKPGGAGVDLMRMFSVVNRINSWKQAWEMFLQNPVFGIGFNQYPTRFPGQNLYGQPFHASAPDNSFLYVLVTTGLAGMTAFIGMLMSWMKMLLGRQWAIVSLVAILMHSFFNNSFFYPWVVMWMGLVFLKTIRR